ncbi:MAG TPA: prenyltransferase/squalene oxidase repeat-containing protein [Pyrinomonadaceae bacterium]|nr:prenyltransferase/squalene oxidase repeat-containing protein [Pyrinomonadaceae bacterium]
MNEVSSQSFFQTAYDELFSWCRQHDFAGHDPFDALNSRLFQATPLAQSRNARLIFTQLVKRSPADVRALIRVPAERNAKGIALFALAQVANYRREKTREAAAVVKEFLSWLLAMRVDGYSGAAWGYNFDWQSRNFFATRNTPTIVPTAFAARALIEGVRQDLQDEYLKVARSVCEFILKDLPRSLETESEICFSYAPQSDTRIFNASLLAAEVLASVGHLTGETELVDVATRATRYVVNNQQPDGSWVYGTDSNQSWKDNFHTAYVLFSLKRIIDLAPAGQEFQPALERGYQFWKTRFFLADGWPKYYDDDPYPVDTHAAASAIVTFLECRDLDPDASRLAQNVANWTIQNLRDRRGFFYYQKRRFYTVRKPYMRWTQAWMLYALSRLLEDLNR